MTWKQLVRKWSEVTARLGGGWSEWVGRGVDTLTGTRDRDALYPPPGVRFALRPPRFPYDSRPRLRNSGATRGGSARRRASLSILAVAAAGLLASPLSGAAQTVDPRCSALASLARFTIISTEDTSRRDLYLGSDVTVGTTDLPGTCSLSRGVCECPRSPCVSEGLRCQSTVDCADGATCNGGLCACQPIPCTIAGQRCVGDGECLVAASGRCDAPTSTCVCSPRAPGCLKQGEKCSVDLDCRVPSWPLGDATGGPCGNGMLITAGNRMGVLATRGDVDFGSQSKCRALRIEREFANTPEGRVKLATYAPFLGPVTRGSLSFGGCALGRGCDRGCVTGARLVLGRGPRPYSSSDGQARRGLQGIGTSHNFKLCDTALTLLEPRGGVGTANPTPFQEAIESYVPLARERFVLGPSNCRACPQVTTSDGGCSACANNGELRTRARTKKLIVSFGSGLQVLDLTSVALQGNTVLELRGEKDTVVLIRVAKGFRLGGEAKVVLASNGSGNGTLHVDKVLWVARGRRGGRPNLSRSSTFRGTLLAADRIGIRLGGGVLAEGALWSRKVSVGAQSTVQHYPFSELLPLPGSGAELFTPVGRELGECVAALLSPTPQLQSATFE